jgi:putative membrane protein (TIGR04086 family)
MPLLALGAAFLGTLTGAFRAAKRAASVKLLAGLCCAGVIFMALFIVGCLASLRVAPSQLAPRLLLAALLGGTLGSVLSGYKPKKRRKKL